MTLPDERYRALTCGYNFLLELLDPKKTPRVPKDIRRQAAWVLRHYPSDYHFNLIAEKLPDHFSKQSIFYKIAENDDDVQPPPEVA